MPTINFSNGTAYTTGNTGPGVPTGGISGQILKKNSTSNYDTSWADLGDTDPATFTSRGTVRERVYNVRDYGAVGDGVTVDNTAVLAAVSALNTAGGGILLFPRGGNYVLSPSIQISNNTHIINEDLITLNPNYVNVGAVLKGIFRIGDTGGTDIVDNVEIEGGRAVGDAFTTYVDKDPVFNPNDHKYVCYVHSVSTHRNCSFHDFKVTNMGSPITLEKVGGVNGTPSRNIHIYNIIEEQVFVGVQMYCNGYLYEDCSVHDIDAKYCYDDVVAIVGSPGGTAGPGIANRISVYNIKGEKTGQAGAFIKLDATSGYLSDISVHNIVGYTNGANEYLVGNIGAVAANNKKLNIGFLQSQGTWSYGVYAQSNGRQVVINDFQLEALYGIHFQANNTPQAAQSIRVTNGNILSRNASLADTQEGNGISFSASNGTQGFQNVFVSGVTTRNKLVPINEGASVPSGTGVQGIYQNTYYSIDVRNRSTSDCVFSSSNRTVKFFKEGQYISESSVLVETNGLLVGTNQIVTSGGKVGVGISPSEVLHVKGGNVQGVRIDSSGVAPILDFYGAGSRNFSFRANYNTDGNFEILRSTTGGGNPTSNVATVSSTGNFGVGHGSGTPSSLFHVVGPIATAYSDKTAAYTLTATDSTVSASGSAATFALTLPTAVGCTGRVYTLKRKNSTNNITVNTTSSQTIDGVTSKSLDSAYAFITVQSDNANWNIIAQGGTVT